eukprot:223815-Prorocentrum_minimum.AAC.1
MLEKHLGMDVAPFMVTKTTLDFLHNQMFFIGSFCQPLFQVAAEWYPTLAPQLNQLTANQQLVEEKIGQLQVRVPNRKGGQKVENRAERVESPRKSPLGLNRHGDESSACANWGAVWVRVRC